jgi:CBS domain-containing protein
MPRPRRAATLTSVTVEEIMQKDVLAVEPLTPLKDVARLLVERAISGVPVVDGTRVLGVVSEEDIVRKERGVRPSEPQPLLALRPR